MICSVSIVAVCLCILTGCTDYDWDTPDTLPNQEGFERHFGFAVPESVSDLYYFADETGFDPAYQLGFRTDQDTIDRIVSELELGQGNPGFGVEHLTRDFPWWDDEDIESLTPYWKTNQDETYYWLLWYNPTSQRAYYLEFGL